MTRPPATPKYDPLGTLYSLLEHDTASSFVDEFAEVPIDASQVLWIMTANDARGILNPILNRMNVFEIDPLTPSQARHIALRLYQSIRSNHDWRARFDDLPADDLLDKLATLVPREMRRALMAAFGTTRDWQAGARCRWMTCHAARPSRGGSGLCNWASVSWA